MERGLLKGDYRPSSLNPIHLRNRPGKDVGRNGTGRDFHNDALLTIALDMRITKRPPDLSTDSHLNHYPEMLGNAPCQK